MLFTDCMLFEFFTSRSWPGKLVLLKLRTFQRIVNLHKISKQCQWVLNMLLPVWHHLEFMKAALQRMPSICERGKKVPQGMFTTAVLCSDMIDVMAES